mgnify:CR=1 FL=1
MQYLARWRFALGDAPFVLQDMGQSIIGQELALLDLILFNKLLKG